MDVNPILLEGEYVWLEPLSVADHLEDLRSSGSESSIFRWFADTYSTPEGMNEFVENALAAQGDGTALPFATVLRETGTAVGSTRFCAISPGKRRVEIGWTWLTPDEQRTPANTEAKYLMLRHAFEMWNCVRVEFETAARNQRARNALSRIGATEEGILRKHMLVQRELRDSAIYSVLDSEWPSVKRELESKLDRPFRG